MKNKIKNIGVILIAIGIIVTILLICGVFKNKYPTFNEIKKLYNDNEESFNIANTYLMNQEPNENGRINYNLDKVEENKKNMTEQEYEALKTIFSQKIVDGYYKNVNHSINYIDKGKYLLKSNYKNKTIYLCYLTDKEEKTNCKHIDGNWYVFYYYPPEY